MTVPWIAAAGKYCWLETGEVDSVILAPVPLKSLLSAAYWPLSLLESRRAGGRTYFYLRPILAFT